MLKSYWLKKEKKNTSKSTSGRMFLLRITLGSHVLRTTEINEKNSAEKVRLYSTLKYKLLFNDPSQIFTGSYVYML